MQLALLTKLLSDRKRKASAAPAVDRCPHLVRPCIGLTPTQYTEVIAPSESVALDDTVVATDADTTGAVVPSSYLECVAADCNVCIRDKTTTTKVIYHFDLSRVSPSDPSKTVAVVTQDDVDFYFPISEFGSVDEFKVSINGNIMRHELFRRVCGARRHGVPVASWAGIGSLVPSGHPQFTAPRGAMGGPATASRAAPKPDAPGSRSTTASGASSAALPRQVPVLYYACVRRVKEQLGESCFVKRASSGPGTDRVGAGPTGNRPVMAVAVQVTGRNLVDKNKRINSAFPMTALPVQPGSFRMTFELPENIRRIVTPNRSIDFLPFIRGKFAEAALDVCGTSWLLSASENAQKKTSQHPGQPLPLTDYLFITETELGPPVEAQCADPLALFILATAIGMMVFFSLTRGLEDY